MKSLDSSQDWRAPIPGPSSLPSEPQRARLFQAERSIGRLLILCERELERSGLSVSLHAHLHAHASASHVVECTPSHPLLLARTLSTDENAWPGLDARPRTLSQFLVPPSSFWLSLIPDSFYLIFLVTYPLAGWVVDRLTCYPPSPGHLNTISNDHPVRLPCSYTLSMTSTTPSLSRPLMSHDICPGICPARLYDLRHPIFRFHAMCRVLLLLLSRGCVCLPTCVSSVDKCLSALLIVDFILCAYVLAPRYQPSPIYSQHHSRCHQRWLAGRDIQPRYYPCRLGYFSKVSRGASVVGRMFEPEPGQPVKTYSKQVADEVMCRFSSPPPPPRPPLRGPSTCSSSHVPGKRRLLRLSFAPCNAG